MVKPIVCLIAAGVLTLVVQHGACAARPASSLLVDNFDYERNQLKGHRSSFQHLHSTAVVTRTPEARFGRGGLGLKINALRRETGYCGVWIHFFDHMVLEPEYLDATEFQYLTFWIRGANGGERFAIKLADEDWLLQDDSAMIGDVNDFLAGGVTKEWQQVQIPLRSNLGLNLQRLGGLTLDFDTPSRATIFLDQIELTAGDRSGPDAKTTAKMRRGVVNSDDGVLDADAGVRAAELLYRNHSQDNLGLEWQMENDIRPGENAAGRALWLWTTEQLLSNPTDAAAFFEFCEEQRITTVWAQLPYKIQTRKHPKETAQSQCLILRRNELSRFLRTAHESGIQVHALDGDPKYARQDLHHIPLAVVDAVLAFNQDNDVSERFAGIHFDNEPYLLPLWHDPEQREQILQEFLTLAQQCQQRVKAASPRIQFGVDIPFWLQNPDENGKPIGEVMFADERKAASYHLIDMVDNVGVMNYRDAAQGNDGMISHASNLLRYADRIPRVKLYLGVETAPADPIRVVFAAGKTRRQFQEAIRGHASQYSAISHVAGKRLRVVCDHDHIHVGIEVGTPRSDAEKVGLSDTICRVALTFGVDPQENPAQAIATQKSLVNLLGQDQQWSNVKACTIRDAIMGKAYHLVRADGQMPDKLTFADEPWKYFQLQTSLAEYQFSKHRGFAGLAIHDYQSVRKLRDRAAGATPLPQKPPRMTLTTAN